MRYDHLFIAFGVLSGAATALLGLHFPAVFQAVPALLWLLIAILMFDLAGAYIRNISVITSVSTTTRLIAFFGGALALILSGGLWS